MLVCVLIVCFPFHPFPSRNRLPYPFSLVVRPLFCLWFAGIPFLFRINMLVATLLIFAVATMTQSEKELEEAVKETECFCPVVIKWLMNAVKEGTVPEELLGILKDF